MRDTALRRISSFTGTDAHPEARSVPSVAGRCAGGVATVLVMGRPYRASCRAGLVGPTLHGVPAVPSATPLPGPWRAAAADDELRRTAVGFDHDDAHWPRVSVPGHWQFDPSFADSDGPLLYRTSFETPVPSDGERLAVVFHGVMYQADVWFDGAYLGDPEGYATSHTFDVTELARLADDHVLAVEVSCPRADATTRERRALLGRLGDGSFFGADWNPGGLWRPVELRRTGAVRIERCRVVCRDANSTRAHLRFHASLDAIDSRAVTIVTSVDGVVMAQHRQSLARGVNAVAWNLDVTKPALWWPWQLGDQPLAEVSVTVFVDEAVSDEHHTRVGLREVSMQDWVLSVNGERLFLKGAIVGPTLRDLAGVDPAMARRDVALARDIGIDLLRVQGHVAIDAFYEAADELGVVVWQDMPLTGGHARSVRRTAVNQAEAIVDRLAHHASVVMWCAHDTPETQMVRQQLPTWNRSVLDRWVRRAVERTDESRPTLPNSGVPPHLPLLDGGDTRLRFGWTDGESSGLAGLAAAMPRLVRFVSEFGAQAAPHGHPLLETQRERWPAIDWAALESDGLDLTTMVGHVDPTDHETLDDWIDATQVHQANLLRRQIETLRRLKYRPTGGFCFTMLADARPTVSTAIVDHERRPKRSVAAVTDACRPVIVVADELPDELDVGATLALDVHAVSDLRRPLDGVLASAHLRWANGEHRWAWQGDVAADDCVRIGTIQFVVPDAVGDLWLDLALEHPDAATTNRYTATITRAG
jgi:beta-mannosidase